MDEYDPSRKVLEYRLTPRAAEGRVRFLAARSGNIAWGDHALERMEEREILDVLVLRVLREGYCQGEPELTVRKEWKCKIVKQVLGSREVGVLVIIQPSRLFVKTVEWEDLP